MHARHSTLENMRHRYSWHTGLRHARRLTGGKGICRAKPIKFDFTDILSFLRVRSRSKSLRAWSIWVKTRLPSCPFCAPLDPIASLRVLASTIASCVGQNSGLHFCRVQRYQLRSACYKSICLQLPVESCCTQFLALLPAPIACIAF